MIQVFGTLRRRSGLSLDAFRLHWRTIHRGHALRVARAGFLGGYVQNHRLDLAMPALRVIADGLPELWFESESKFDAMRQSAVLQPAKLDEPNFADMSGYQSLVVGEEDFQRGEADRRKCVGLLKLILLIRSSEDDGETADATSTLNYDEAVRVGWNPSRALGVGAPTFTRLEMSWWSSFSSFNTAWSQRGASNELEGVLVEERPVFWPGESVPQFE